MRAVAVTTFGGPEVLEIVEMEVPEPSTGQVRVKVAAATVNPTDLGARTGYLGETNEPISLGWDVAGTIDATGLDTDWHVGDEVVAMTFGHVRPVGMGTHADYVIVDAAALAKAPVTLDATLATTLPLNGRTADQALELLDLRPGQSLLVTGAAGAVGGFAVQLAVHQGIEVTGLARQSDEPYVRSLGATHFISTTAQPGRVDAVLDAAQLGEATLDWVHDGGAFVSLRPGGQPASVRGIRTTSVSAVPDAARLTELVTLSDEGVLTTRVAKTYPLTEVAKAHAHLAEGGLRGRLVLVP
jgi:NADPH:quinone reductase-like Zn-dependent oxidoreductase